MPNLPPLSVQIEKGINSWCADCKCPIEQRSMRCRRCHSALVARKMYPPEKRLKRECRDCGKEISHKSAKGKRRCKACDIIHRGNPAAYDDYSHYNGSLATREEASTGNHTDNENKGSACRQKNPASHHDRYERVRVANEVIRANEYRHENRNNCPQPIQRVCDNDILAFNRIFTMADAWAALGKCWRDFKIAQSKDDQESMAIYRRRIQFLGRLLKLPPE